MRTFLLVLALALPGLGADARIEIDAAKKASYTIPRTIYGTFLEPIGNSIYPGLWAQVLENPSFEDNLWSAEAIRRKIENEPALGRASQIGLPLPWEPLDASQGNRYEPRWNDAANSFRSLLVMALPGKQTGVRQEVYLPVRRVRRYAGSIWAKQVSGPARLEISLRRRNRPDAVLARAAIDLSPGEWRRYEFALELAPDGLRPLEPADFAIALEDEARALIDQAFLFPADHVDGMDPDMVALSKALRTPVVRYGGNFTSGYHWKDGVGPMDKRVTMLNQSWGMPEYNHFGTVEFLRFCELIGAEPQIALNLGSGTPAEAAEWVRFVNAHWRGGSTGLLWELGNELWGNFQIGYPTLARVAAHTRSYSEAIRAVDPQARLIATGQDPDHFREWNAAQMTNPPGSFEYLATHFVVGNGSVTRREATPEFVALSAFALPVGLERHLREMKQQIDETPGWRSKLQIAFTEWLFHGPDDRVPRFTNMGGAICTAGFLNSLIRVADFTPVSDMTGLIEFGGIYKKRGQAYGVPAYWAFRMYSTSDAVQPLETRTDVEKYSIEQGNNRIPSIPDVPYLDVVSALDAGGGKLTVFAVNRDAKRDITAEVKLAGFTARGRARVLTLTGVSIYQPNDEARPEAVHPVESVATAGPGGFEYRFPRGSVTRIELTR
jgi:alpha-L-arabinofuranosidase